MPVAPQLSGANDLSMGPMIGLVCLLMESSWGFLGFPNMTAQLPAQVMLTWGSPM